MFHNEAIMTFKFPLMRNAHDSVTLLGKLRVRYQFSSVFGQFTSDLNQIRF